MKNNRFWLFIIGAVALLSILAILLLPLLRQEGDTVVIKVDGEVIHTLPLAEDQRLRIPTTDGGYNLVVIEGGKVKITEADCPDGRCTRHKPTSQTADSIVCLPHRLTVSVVAGSGRNLDGVVG